MLSSRTLCRGSGVVQPHENVADYMELPWPARFGDHDLQHSLHIARDSSRNIVRLYLDISHAIIDGYSGRVLLNDFLPSVRR